MSNLEDKQTILIVDDSVNNIDMLRGILHERYSLKVALDGKTALEVARSEPAPDLILLDIVMPLMDGYEVCRQLKKDSNTMDIPIIFVSGKGEVEDEKKGLELGAIDYFKKPFSHSIVKTRVGIHLEMHRLQEHLEYLVEERTEHLQRTLEQTVSAMARMVEKKDPYTAGHQLRVADLVVEIAREMKLKPDAITAVRLAATVHDVGKASVPAEFLNRPGGLTDYEFAIVKQHSDTGYEILKDIEFPWPIAMIVRQHHERMDGSGYPDGIEGEDILIEARILAVADVVEAMSSHRPYRPALGIDLALEEIEKGQTIKYDAGVVDACLRLFREKAYELPEGY